MVARRGRAVADRFGLARRFELTLQVGNAYAPETRLAIARIEAAVASVVGVRRVTGPTRLLSLRVDDVGRITTLPLFAAASSPIDLTVQSQLARRADALGWFVSPDGSVVRLLIDVDDDPPPQEALGAAVASSGLSVLAGGIPLRAVWPEP